MLKWLAKMFEKVCTVCVIANFVIGGVAGGVAGVAASGVGGVISGINNISTITIPLCIIGGLIIAFFINIMGFGFLAQIIEIRKKIDLLEQIVETRDEEDLLTKSSDNID